jgi:hypothetical protein
MLTDRRIFEAGAVNKRRVPKCAVAAGCCVVSKGGLAEGIVFLAALVAKER